MKKLILTHDIGTSGDKAALVDQEGRIIRTHTASYGDVFFRDGRTEQDPEEWWKAFCVNNAVLLEDIALEDIVAVILTGQMMCCLPLDKKGEPLYAAITWADIRAEEEAAYLEQMLGKDEYYEITGMRSAAGYTLPKIMWLKKHKNEIYRKASVFVSPKDFINGKLTGCFAVDAETAAYMHCFDRRTNGWSRNLLEAAGVDQEKMPCLIPAGSIIGTLLPVAAKESGLVAGIPIVMGPGDGGAATFGSGVTETGEAYTSIGTSSWVCAVSAGGKTDAERRISKISYFNTQRDSGTMQAGGYAYHWICKMLYARELSLLDGYRQIDQYTADSPPGARGLLFLPYLLGERAPFWDSAMLGAFIGLHSGTTRQDMCRSVMEGVAFHMRIILDIIRELNKPAGLVSMKLIGGGGRSPLWTQIFADVYDLPVSSVACPDHAATLGMAVLAGVAVGMFQNTAVIRQFQRVVSITEPHTENAALYQELFTIFRDSAAGLTEINHRLKKLAPLKSYIGCPGGKRYKQ